MIEDRTELNDLRGQHAALEAELTALHEHWCREIGVRDWGELERVFLTY